MQEFLRRARSPDVRCVQEDFVARFEYWSRSSLIVIVPLHVVLCFVDCGLRFFDCVKDGIPEEGDIRDS